MATFPLMILKCFPSVCFSCRHPCFISGEWLSCQIGSYLTGSDLLFNWIQNMKYSKYGEQRDLPNYPHISIIFQTHTTHRRNVNMHEYWTHAHLHTDTRTYTLFTLTHLIHFISDLSGMCSPPLPHFQMVWVLQMSKLASKNSILWWEAQLASKSFPKTVFSAFSCKIDAVTEKSAGFQIIIFCWEEVGF